MRTGGTAYGPARFYFSRKVKQMSARGKDRQSGDSQKNNDREHPGRSLLDRVYKLLPARRRIILIICLAVVFALSVTMLILDHAQGVKEETALRKLAAISSGSIESAAAFESTSPGPVPTPQVPVILAQYKELHEQNTDMTGWIKIDGTVIDYPVMYTADDFYLSHGFDKKESKSGVPFIDARCTIDPFGTNTIIYGHHMKNGAMFASLVEYEDEEYYREHPVIRFDTLYDQCEYEIIAVFQSQIYRKSDTVYKHYNFLNAESKAEFDTYICHIKDLSLYDTGVTAAYGDKLLTLVTCAYHTEHGQFVIVAKKSGEMYRGSAEKDG